MAVLITKALIEIPPKFAGKAPVNPGWRERSREERAAGVWNVAQGLAEDVRWYGKWIRDEAEKRIGHLYPKVKLPREQGGGEAVVIAWLYCRTVKCPNPACGAMMPLASKFWLSTKKGKKAWVEPVIDRKDKTVRFEVKTGEGEAPEGTKQRRKSRCLFCKTNNISDSSLREQSKTYGVGSQMLAIVAEGSKGRIYLNSVMSGLFCKVPILWHSPRMY